MQNDYESALRRDGKLIFVPGGDSMWPTLKHEGQSVVVLPKKDKLRLYDVPLYKRADGQYVLHRVVGFAAGGYVVCGDSQFGEEYVAEGQIVGVLDGFFKGKKYVSADDRIWMTAQSAPYPHWISIDIGEIQLIRGILFTPSVFRGACLGPIRRYRILAGDSPDRIRTPVAEGVFDNMQNNPVPQTIVFSSPIPARYFRFEALESADGGCQASAARIEIL